MHEEYTAQHRLRPLNFRKDVRNLYEAGVSKGNPRRNIKDYRYKEKSKVRREDSSNHQNPHSLENKGMDPINERSG